MQTIVSYNRAIAKGVMKICYLPALKPGRIGSPGSCFVCHPGQTHFKNYSGLDHVQCEMKECVIWRCNNADVHSSWAMPTFVIVLWCLLVNESNTPVSYVYVCVKSDHLQVCIEPFHQSIAVAAPGVLPLKYFSFTWDYFCVKHVH